MKLQTEHNDKHYRIEEDNSDVGCYLYVYHNGVCTHDYLQNDVVTCKEFALEEFGVPIETWNDIPLAAQQNIEIAKAWFKAFNEHHLENLLALYDDDAQHYSPKLKIRQPETNGLVKGKAALRAWWQDAFDRLPTLHYKTTSLTADDERVFMEYIRQVDNEPDMLVAEVLEIKDGLIIASRVYHG